MDSCAHEWDYNAPQRAEILGHRRRCSKCLIQQIWRLKLKPSPQDSPQLGEWEQSPVWLNDWVRHWTDGTQPVSREEL